MSECMQFPETWEEFEQAYGFEDKKEIYTNGSRLIQSFRVKQWLDHIAKPERTAKLEHTYQVGENWFCENCGQQLNAYSWETPQNLAELGNENAHVSEVTSQNDGGTSQKLRNTSQITCPKCHSEFVILPDANNPLTWDELCTMEGKPVWVEGEHGCIWNFKSWVLIRLDTENDDLIICIDNNYEFAIGQEDYGTDWQAYRKERS